MCRLQQMLSTTINIIYELFKSFSTSSMIRLFVVLQAANSMFLSEFTTSGQLDLLSLLKEFREVQRHTLHCNWPIVTNGFFLKTLRDVWLICYTPHIFPKWAFGLRRTWTCLMRGSFLWNEDIKYYLCLMLLTLESLTCTKMHPVDRAKYFPLTEV